jgi:pyridinium-3,5-bisthiocarboxylic acid mononucleotide nickel chelatase
MKVAYFDCATGASGDMILAALVDAGLSPQIISNTISMMGLQGCDLEVKKVYKGAISATKINVITPLIETHRHLSDLIEIVKNTSVSNSVKSKALEVLNRIGKSEAKIHNLPLENIHLHEVGGDDTLIDIVGTLIGLETLGIERVFSSPLPLTRGWITAAHGQIPLPAPATLSLLKETPIYYIDDFQAELVTPTGAALLTSISSSFGGFPDMVLKEIGIGAGSKDLPIPNIIRLWIGETNQSIDQILTEKLVLLETNIDNMNPEIYGHLMELLFNSGALDVYFTPIQMKKNRPGVQVSVLCHSLLVGKMQNIIFRETPTLGIKHLDIHRISLPREFQTVSTEFGDIKIKISQWKEKIHGSPEYEDCRKAALLYNVSIERVIEAALYEFNKKTETLPH